MKYIKRYDSNKYVRPSIYELSFDKNSSLEEQIIDYVNDVTYNNYISYQNDIDECPFATEMAILHQQNYIDDLYVNLSTDSFYNIEKYKQIDFIRKYNELIKKARKKIYDELKKDPSLYDKWPLDYEGLDIPEYIKNASKYNV